VLEKYVRDLRCVKFKSSRLVQPTLSVRCFPSPQLSVHESCLWKSAERRMRDAEKTHETRYVHCTSAPVLRDRSARVQPGAGSFDSCMQVCSSVVENHHAGDSAVLNYWTREIDQCL
jgi:hypothetical protein